MCLQSTAFADAQVPTLGTLHLHSHFCHQGPKAVWQAKWSTAQRVRKDRQHHVVLPSACTVTQHKNVSTLSHRIFTSGKSFPQSSLLSSEDSVPLLFSIFLTKGKWQGTQRGHQWFLTQTHLMLKFSRCISFSVCTSPTGPWQASWGYGRGGMCCFYVWAGATGKSELFGSLGHFLSPQHSSACL